MQEPDTQSELEACLPCTGRPCLNCTQVDTAGKTNKHNTTSPKKTKQNKERPEFKNALLSRAWWRTPVIPALGRLRQEDRCEFETSLGYKSELKASLNCIRDPVSKRQKKKRKSLMLILYRRIPVIYLCSDSQRAGITGTHPHAQP